MTPIPRSLLGIIQHVRPVAALLTSYTFDLGLFDSLFLPALQKVGCHQTTVLLDPAQGLQAALEVCGSRAAGIDYALHGYPMTTNGVFHPKIAYLHAGKQAPDVLVIGSGNLTAAGQGQQLETLDAVRADEAPAVFAELAQVLHLLAVRLPEGHPATRPLTMMASRAQEQSMRYPAVSPHTCWLVHTLEQKAHHQFAALARSLAVPPGGTLSVLAPFHDEKGWPVQVLARALGAQTIQIGVAPGAKTVPCDPDAFPTEQFALVQPADVNRRAVHAKVFSYTYNTGTLEMTGSVNATRKSLDSTDNVEIGLVRHIGLSAFRWNRVNRDTVTFEANPEPKGSMDAVQPLLLEAWLVDNRLEGMVLGLDAGVTVELMLWGDGQALLEDSLSATVDAAGRFCVPRPLFDWNEMGVQLELLADGRQGRAWLMMHEQLAQAALHSKIRRCLTKANELGPDALEDTLLALLIDILETDTVAVLAAKEGTGSDPAATGPEPSSAGGERQSAGHAASLPHLTTLENWELRLQARSAPVRRGWSDALLVTLWAVLEGRTHLERTLLNDLPNRETLRADEDLDDDAAPGEAPLPNPPDYNNDEMPGSMSAPTSRRAAHYLDRFLQFVQRHAEHPAAPEVLRLLLHMLLRDGWNQSNRAASLLPCEQWLSGLTLRKLPLHTWPELQAAAVQLVILLYYAHLRERRRPPLGHWKEQLEAILGQAVPAGTFLAAASAAPTLHPAWATLSLARRSKLATRLERTCSDDQRLINLLASAFLAGDFEFAAKNGLPAPAPEKPRHPVRLPKHWQSLFRQALEWRRNYRKARAKQAVGRTSPAPFVRIVYEDPNLPDDKRNSVNKLLQKQLPELKRERILPDGNGGWLLYLKQPEVLNKLEKGFYHVQQC